MLFCYYIESVPYVGCCTTMATGHSWRIRICCYWFGFNLDKENTHLWQTSLVRMDTLWSRVIHSHDGSDKGVSFILVFLRSFVYTFRKVYYVIQIAWMLMSGIWWTFVFQ